MRKAIVADRQGRLCEWPGGSCSQAPAGLSGGLEMCWSHPPRAQPGFSLCILILSPASPLTRPTVPDTGCPIHKEDLVGCEEKELFWKRRRLGRVSHNFSVSFGLCPSVSVSHLLHLPVSMSVSVPFSLFFFVSISGPLLLCLSPPLSLCLCRSVFLSLSLSLPLSLPISVFLGFSVSSSLLFFISVSLSPCFSVCHSLSLSASVALCLSISVCLCLSVEWASAYSVSQLPLQRVEGVIFTH